MPDFRVKITLTAKDNASGAISRVGGASDKLGKSSGGLTAILGRGSKALSQLAGGSGQAATALGTLGGPHVAVATQAIGAVANMGLRAARALGRTFVGGVKRVLNAVKAIAIPIVNLGKKLTGLTALATAAGIALAAVLGRSAVKAFADFEQSIVNAISVTGTIPSQVGAATEAMSEFALVTSRESAKSALEIADAMYALGSAGLTLEQQVGATPGVVKLAEATMAEMGQTAELVTSTMKAFGLEAGDTGRITNVFAKAISTSRLNMERLSTGMPIVAAQANALGVPLEMTAAAFATLTDRGLDASTASTSLRQVFAKTLNQGKQGQQILAKYGLSMAAVSVETRGFAAVLDALRGANISQADLSQLFDVRAVSAANILIGQGGRALEDYSKTLSDSTALTKMHNTQMNTLKSQWAIVKSTFDEVKILLGKGMGPALRSVVDWIQKYMKALAGSGELQKFGAFIGNLARSGFVLFVRAIQIGSEVLGGLGQTILGLVHGSLAALMRTFQSGSILEFWQKFLVGARMGIMFVLRRVPRMIRIFKIVLNTLMLMGAWLLRNGPTMWAKFVAGLEWARRTGLGLLGMIQKILPGVITFGQGLLVLADAVLPLVAVAVAQVTAVASILGLTFWLLMQPISAIIGGLGAMLEGLAAVGEAAGKDTEKMRLMGASLRDVSSMMTSGAGKALVGATVAGVGAPIAAAKFQAGGGFSRAAPALQGVKERVQGLPPAESLLGGGKKVDVNLNVQGTPEMMRALMTDGAGFRALTEAMEDVMRSASATV